MTSMIFLFVCAGLSFNLILYFGLGLQSITLSEEKSSALSLPFFQAGVLFASVLILWLILTFLLPFLAFGFIEYFLLFPFSVLVCVGVEYLSVQVIPSLIPDKKHFSADTGYNGLVFASLFLTLQLAEDIFSALVLSLSFALGTLLTMFLLHYIHKRSILEAVPANIRGRPLMLITLGLLSLIFSSLTTIFFKILEVF